MYGRSPGTQRDGRSFDWATVEAVWQKGQVVSGYDPGTWRKDTCGAWMKRTDHGLTSEYGWEVDHIVPVAQGAATI